MTDQAEDADVIVNLPARREKRELMAGAPVRAIVPTSMEEAYRIAQHVVAADMCPKDMKTPEKCLIAIMQGLEVGMTPMQSIQRIAIINGRPTIWGDAAIGLVRASGKAEYIKEWFEGDGDNFTAHCETKRRGEAHPIRGAFSVYDAKIAKLWGKAGPWLTTPKRMLQMRARGFTLRDGYADVLCGMYLAEELEDDRQMRDVTPQPEPSFTPPTPPGEPTMQAPEVRAPSQGKAAPRPRHKPQRGRTGGDDAREEMEDRAREVEAEAMNAPLTNDEADKYLADLEVRLKACPLEEIESIYFEYVEQFQDRMFPPDQAKAEALFEAAYDRHAPDESNAE